jgi:hypothetical protein
MATTNIRSFFKPDWVFIYLSSKKFFSDRQISAIDRAIIAADRAQD